MYTVLRGRRATVTRKHNLRYTLTSPFVDSCQLTSYLGAATQKFQNWLWGTKTASSMEW